MSRIHEALKKAEQERASIVTAEAELAPLQAESTTATATATAEPARNAEAPLPSGDILSRTALPATGSGQYLRFDDLRARRTSRMAPGSERKCVRESRVECSGIRTIPDIALATLPNAK
jgi:hypothetical protein